jgi:carbamoyltransferase
MVGPAFNASIRSLIASNGHGPSVAHAARIADGVQRQLGDLLLQLLQDVKARVGGGNLCLGGGLFFNSYFNSVLAQSGVFERTFVPANPGNTGAAIGAALIVAGRDHRAGRARSVSAFLGPEYQIDEIKTTLDNCKLSYDYHHNGQVIERTAAALAKGQLVGWFQGRMEWGSRALGNRSILASPVAPYVLDNLNLFLKRREPHRPYSVSVCEEDAARFFRGPATSRFMEYEYEVIQPDILRHLLPLDATRLRVQTVPESAGLFHQLLKASAALTGVPMLVNTSFNGFNEPIVCTPRDAVRVFYGTGLDLVVLGSFMLRK